MAAVRTAPARHATVHPLTVSSIERLTDDAVTVTFDVPDELADTFAFTQGQHISLIAPELGDGLRRSYSLCTPAGSGVLRVAVKLLPDGVFSGYVHSQLRPGDVLQVVSPSGRFFTALDAGQAKDYVAIAAGSGVTPILSIAATTLEVEPRSTFTILYGNRTTATVMFVEELSDLKNRYPERFVLHTVFSREEPEAELLHGRIDAPKLQRFLDTLMDAASTDEWFLCGPLEMVEELRGVLHASDVDPRRIHRELFHAGPAPVVERTSVAAEGTTSAVTVVLDGRSSSFELSPHGEPILDAALRVRPDAPYACKGGVCGTCRAYVVEGEVEMTGGYALEPDELDAGFVLACQSHPRTPAVTLDFDR
jgi:ring-1,2-phenylacetyl-CoA epoxidase subunit PaaE